jgi:hypothetical protein
LAHTVATAALNEIEMDVALVVAVGARAEHRGEMPAGRFFQVYAQILRDIHIG